MPVKTLMLYRKYMGEGGVGVYVPVYGHVWIAEARACDDSRGIVYVVAGWSQRGRGQFPNPKIWGWLITELEWVHIVMRLVVPVSELHVTLALSIHLLDVHHTVDRRRCDDVTKYIRLICDILAS